MGNFNLLFHGMMLMDEVSDRDIQVCFPAVPKHHFMFGSPGESASCSFIQLKELPLGELTLEMRGDGLVPERYYLRDRLSSLSDVLLRKSAVQRTGYARSVLHVPKPARVRACRTAEVSGSAVTGNTPNGAFVGLPLTLSEVTIFRYNVPSGTVVKLLGTDWERTIPPPPDDFVNLCVYAQCIDDCDHDTQELNKLLRVNGELADLQLAAIGAADGPHNTPFGVAKCQMLSLPELKIASDTNPGGCGKGWLIMDNGDGPR